MTSASPPRSAAAMDDPAQPVLDWWNRMLETDPVHCDEQGAWHVFRHADVAEVLADRPLSPLTRARSCPTRRT